MTRTPGDAQAAAEIRAREPIFHRGLAGRPPAEIEAAVHPEYWEVGASGTAYTREAVVGTVAGRQADPDPLPVDDFALARLDETTWLATYLLRQGDRRTRRATVWQWRDGAWVIRYHQGTIVAP